MSEKPPVAYPVKSDDRGTVEKMLQALELFAARTGQFANSVQGSGIGNAGSVNIMPGAGKEGISAAGSLATSMTEVGKFANAYGIPLPSFFPALSSAAKLGSLVMGDSHSTGDRNYSISSIISSVFGDSNNIAAPTTPGKIASPVPSQASKVGATAAAVSPSTASRVGATAAAAFPSPAGRVPVPAPQQASSDRTDDKLLAAILRLDATIQQLAKTLGGGKAGDTGELLKKFAEGKLKKDDITSYVKKAASVASQFGGKDSDGGGGSGIDLATCLTVARTLALLLA